jgi:hypothetical protein
MRCTWWMGLALVAGCDHQVDMPDDVNVVDTKRLGALNVSHHRPGDRSIHIATVDLCEPGIELRATGPNDGTRTVSSWCCMRKAGSLCGTPAPTVTMAHS